MKFLSGRPSTSPAVLRTGVLRDYRKERHRRRQHWRDREKTESRVILANISPELQLPTNAAQEESPNRAAAAAAEIFRGPVPSFLLSVSNIKCPQETRLTLSIRTFFLSDNSRRRLVGYSRRSRPHSPPLPLPLSVISDETSRTRRKTTSS